MERRGGMGGVHGTEETIGHLCGLGSWKREPQKRRNSVEEVLLTYSGSELTVTLSFENGSDVVNFSVGSAAVVIGRGA